MNYPFLKNNKPMNTEEFNSILSVIYAPIIPAIKIQNNTIIHYKKNDDDFYVLEKDKQVSVIGNISNNLTNKLKDYGVKQNA